MKASLLAIINEEGWGFELRYMALKKLIKLERLNNYLTN